MTPVIDPTAATGVWVATTRSGTVYAIDTASWRVWRTPAPGAIPAALDGQWTWVDAILPMAPGGIPGTVVVGAQMGLIHHSMGGARMHLSATVTDLHLATPDDLTGLAPRLPARAVPATIKAARERT